MLGKAADLPAGLSLLSQNGLRAVSRIFNAQLCDAETTVGTMSNKASWRFHKRQVLGLYGAAMAPGMHMTMARLQTPQTSACLLDIEMGRHGDYGILGSRFFLVTVFGRWMGTWQGSKKTERACLSRKIVVRPHFGPGMALLTFLAKCVGPTFDWSPLSHPLSDWSFDSC